MKVTCPRVTSVLVNSRILVLSLLYSLSPISCYKTLEQSQSHISVRFDCLSKCPVCFPTYRTRKAALVLSNLLASVPSTRNLFFVIPRLDLALAAIFLCNRNLVVAPKTCSRTFSKFSLMSGYQSFWIRTCFYYWWGFTLITIKDMSEAPLRLFCRSSSQIGTIAHVLLGDRPSFGTRKPPNFIALQAKNFLLCNEVCVSAPISPRTNLASCPQLTLLA